MAMILWTFGTLSANLWARLPDLAERLADQFHLPLGRPSDRAALQVLIETYGADGNL